MKLRYLMIGVFHRCICGDEEIDIKGISWHSDKVKCQDAFVCVSGQYFDGHDFIESALKQGAKALIVSDEKTVPTDFSGTVILVEDTQKALATMSLNFFNCPSEELITVAVTGTKGKTTTCYMVRNILNHSGIKTGMISTVAIDDGKKISDTEMTTPTAFEIHKNLRNMVENGCKVCVIEVSSQGVMRKRIHGIFFDIGVFTNISRDHIGPGEHNSFEEYFRWKCQLFHNCKTGIVNREDIYAKRLIKTGFCKFKTYGNRIGTWIKADKIVPSITKNSLGIEFRVKGVYNINLFVPIAGRFNVSNALAACMVAAEFGVAPSEIKEAMKDFRVPGRMEVFKSYKDGYVVVDYAHNGKSLEKLLMTLREYKHEKIICLFGCGGNRSIDRRLEMGEISGKLANLSIITSDNPRFEPQMVIINDIIKGISKTSGRYIVIPDRAEAIRKALEITTKDNFLVIAGKGHEKYQIINDKKIHFDDIEIVKSSIERCSYEQNYSR